MNSRILNELQIKFLNQLVQPCQDFFNLVVAHPFLLHPSSNSILHKFESVTLAIFHYQESLGLNNRFSEEFALMANSIKHGKHNEKVIELSAATDFEVDNNRFRFIKNTVLGVNSKTGMPIDPETELFGALNVCAKLVCLEGKLPTKNESTYPFFSKATTYHFPEHSAHTAAANLRFFCRTATGLALFDPQKIDFIALTKDFAGKEG